MLVRPLVRSVVSPLVRGVTQRTRRGVVFGPELLVNADPMAAAGWTVTGTDATHLATFSGGTLRYQSGTTSPQLLVTQSVFTIGKLYEVTVVVSASAGGALKFDAFTGWTITGAGTFTRRSTAAQASLGMNRATTNVDTTISRMSAREILSGA